jgi:hypothetical protein
MNQIRAKDRWRNENQEDDRYLPHEVYYKSPESSLQRSHLGNNMQRTVHQTYKNEYDNHSNHSSLPSHESSKYNDVQYHVKDHEVDLEMAKESPVVGYCIAGTTCFTIIGGIMAALGAVGIVMVVCLILKIQYFSKDLSAAYSNIS